MLYFLYENWLSESCIQEKVQTSCVVRLCHWVLETEFYTSFFLVYKTESRARGRRIQISQMQMLR